MRSIFFGHVHVKFVFFVDDHDVVRFSVNSLRSPEMALASDSVHDAESQKFELEFEEYQKKLDQQKDEWAQQNPDKVAHKLIRGQEF